MEKEIIKGNEIIMRRDKEEGYDYIYFFDSCNNLILKVDFIFWNNIDGEAQKIILNSIRGFYG
jgi:hypothetical protein